MLQIFLNFTTTVLTESNFLCYLQLCKMVILGTYKYMQYGRGGKSTPSAAKRIQKMYYLWLVANAIHQVCEG